MQPKNCWWIKEDIRTLYRPKIFVTCTDLRYSYRVPPWDICTVHHPKIFVPLTALKKKKKSRRDQWQTLFDHVVITRVSFVRLFNPWVKRINHYLTNEASLHGYNELPPPSRLSLERKQSQGTDHLSCRFPLPELLEIFSADLRLHATSGGICDVSRGVEFRFRAVFPLFAKMTIICTVLSACCTETGSDEWKSYF